MEDEIEKPMELPIGNPELTAQKKHTAMLERLSSLHQSRLKQTVDRRSVADASLPFESIQSFLALFSNARRSIESDLHHCRALAASNRDDRSLIKPELEKVSASISNMEKLVAEQSYSLPPYEVRSSLQTIWELKKMVESANAELVPRKKFSFKGKPLSKKEPAVLVEKDVDFNNVSDAAKPNFGSWELPGFKNLRGEILVKHFRVFESEGEFIVTDLESCDVYIKGRMRALFIHRLKNCRIFSGPVLGSVLMEEVNGCLFMLSSHQIRIHQARECDFYLRVRSRPIVEDCNNVRFAPYRLFYQGIDEDLSESDLEEETGNWANVDDFRWLRAVQSPNWSLIPEEEYADVRDISELEEKSR